MYDVQSSADEAMVKGGEREKKKRTTEKITLSQRPREGDFALTAPRGGRTEIYM